MVFKLLDREPAVTSIPPEDWRSVARRFALLALLVVGITAHAVQFYLSLRQFESGPPVAPTTYVARFTEIAATEGRPYRDFPVEYPPVSLAAIEVSAGSNGNETGANMVWLILVCDLVTVAALSYGWGTRTAVAYLFLTAPLLGFLYTTIDLIAVALAVGAVALVVRGRERLGGVALAAAVLAKVWPLVLVPIMVLERKRRALVWSSASLAVGTFVWVWWGGASGLVQVATQRQTPGWEYESLVGSVFWALGDDFVIMNDSTRVGVAPGWAKAMLLVAALAGIAAVWYRASRRHPRELGFPAMAAISILMLSAPLLSPPYMIWLAPWAAIAWMERTGYVRWLMAALMLVSGVMFLAFSSEYLYYHAVWSVKAILLLRNALLAAVPAVYLLEGRISPSTGSVAPIVSGTRLKIRPSASS